jgi:threonine-phosphate decarboxylase
LEWPAHGANPHILFEALNLDLPTKNNIDFSANINPMGPPPAIAENWDLLWNHVTDYPDPGGRFLKKKLAEKEKVSENQILIGNGGAEIISLIGRILPGKKALIVQPAFSEYEEACRVNDCQVEYHSLKNGTWEWEEGLEAKIEQADALFLCNPNNPTGMYYPLVSILPLLEECRKKDCLLIIDEAFYDFVADYEGFVAYIHEYKNLMIIRSMTKMFAIPGLRLGYLLGDEKILEQISAYQPHWSTNSLALKAGEWCVDSEAFVKETQELIEAEKTRIFAFYNEHSFEFSPSSTNFYLLRDPELEDQLPFFLFLLKRGIIPRHTMNFPGLEGRWLRFAVKSPTENDRLMEEAARWRSRGSLL